MPSNPSSAQMSEMSESSSSVPLLQSSPVLDGSAVPATNAITESLAPWRLPLSRALHRNRAQPFCRYLQLATVRPEGTPANRTIVFRGFLANTNRLMFICDRRSEKTDHIIQNPAAEACWYFTKTREQFRLSGHLALITAETGGAVEANSTEVDSVEAGSVETGSVETGSVEVDSVDTHGKTDLKKVQIQSLQIQSLQLQSSQIARQKAAQQARHTVWQNISANAKIQFAWPHPKAPRADSAAFSPPAPDEQIPPSTFCLLLLTVHSVDHLALRGEPQTRTLYELTDEGLRREDLTSEDLTSEDLTSESTTASQSEGWRTISVNP